MTDILSLSKPYATSYLNIALLDADSTQAENLKASLLRTFEQISVKTYSNPSDFLQNNYLKNF